MAWADLVLPEDQLAAMLVECQPVRAIVANPTATWAELAVILDAGNVAEGSTADHVKTSLFDEEEDSSDYVERPRFVVSHHEQDTYTRTSSSGFSLTGRLFVLAELPIPAALVDDEAGAKDDVRQKRIAIMQALCDLSRANPRLDLVALQVEEGVKYAQEENGDSFAIIQCDVTFGGATA